MTVKEDTLSRLAAEYRRWEDLLAGLSEAQIVDRRLPANLSIKDVIAHLLTWQQRSIARFDAALGQREPVYAGWPAGLAPEGEEDLDEINAWIFKTHQERPWPEVLQDWRAGGRRLLELGAAVPEADLLDKGKYPWLASYSLLDVLEGAYDHHQREHLEPLQARLREQGEV